MPAYLVKLPHLYCSRLGGDTSPGALSPPSSIISQAGLPPHTGASNTSPLIGDLGVPGIPPGSGMRGLYNADLFRDQVLPRDSETASSMSSFPLTTFENKARIHAHVAFFAYLVALPLGIFIARYLRTFTNSWFWPHAIVNFVITGPLVFTGFALGYQTTSMGGELHFVDPHQKVGLALLVMYVIQVFLGAFIHWVKLPFRFPGGRHPQNYLHAILGLATVALATWQTHYGLWIEWAYVTGNGHPVNWRCKDFWLAIVVVIWSLYAIGLFLLPRQFRQEAASRRAKEGEGLNDDVPLI